MKTRAKFKIGDKVRLTDEYSKPNYEYRFGKILSPYNNSIRRVGEVKDIIFDGKYNIYYVKFKDNTITYPFYGKYLELYVEQKKNQPIKNIIQKDKDNHSKEIPSYTVGQYVKLAPKAYEELAYHGSVHVSELRKLQYTKDSPVAKIKESIIDKDAMYKITNIAYDKTNVIYGLEGFGPLYFYEDEIELVEPQTPVQAQEQDTTMIYTILNTLESIVEKGKDIDVELI
jgi:hypothetical protein